MRQPGFGGEIPTNCIELPVSQRADQVTSDRDLVYVTSGQPSACQGIDPPIQRGADLGIEWGGVPSRTRNCHALAPVGARLCGRIG